MNWYKKAQNITEQYQKALEQAAAAVQITGTGQNEMISIPGVIQTIQARDLLNRVKSHIAPILIQHNVTEIDTSPISQATAQGLAISHEPGKIHVDVAKIFNQAKQQLPAVTQLDGMQPDTDALNSIIHQVSQWIEAELAETIAHEGQHVGDYFGAFQENKPFTTVQEQPAVQFGQQVRQRYYQ